MIILHTKQNKFTYIQQGCNSVLDLKAEINISEKGGGTVYW